MALVRRVIHRKSGRLAACLRTATAWRQQQVVIRLIIKGDGKVKDGQILESTNMNGFIERCVAKVLRRLVFPTPPNGEAAEATFAMRF